MKKRRLLLLSTLLLTVRLSSWETAIAGVLTTPPAQGQDFRIYSTADDRALHCLDSTTGKEYWNFRTGRRLTGFTIVSPDHSILIMTVQNQLISVSPGGRELWRYQLEKAPDFPPSVDPYGSVYLASGTGRLISIDRTGVKTWERKMDFSIKQLFSLQDRLLVTGVNRTVILNLDGTVRGEIDSAPNRLIYISPDLFWEEPGGFSRLNTEKMVLEASESPLPDGIIFPEPEILITYQNTIVSGRKDWFMEALEAGEKAYFPFYQTGNNPGRSGSINELPDARLRYERFSARGGAPLLPLLEVDPSYLDQILSKFEKAENLQSLLKIDPDYDLMFRKILSDSHIISLDVYRPRIDEYSRYRIYGVLSRWGNLNSRETLLFLGEAEKDPHNLMLIMDGLGRIGLDYDQRSMNIILKIADRFPRNESVTAAAVRNVSRLARYNGGRSLLSMMNYFNALQQKQISASILNLIRDELNTF